MSSSRPSSRPPSRIANPEPDPYPYPYTPHGTGALATLIRNRSQTSMRDAQHKGVGPFHFGGDEGDDDDDDADDTTRLLRHHSNDSPRRQTAEERRLSQIIFSPQMRSMRLIGNSNPRYQWDRYWKTQDQLKSMTKPLRQYYERNNDLIRMYLYIDQLLDSSVPHDLLNEYSESLDASAFRHIDVPHTISEEPPTPLEATPKGPSPYGSLIATEHPTNGVTPDASSTNSASTGKRLPKRNPKEIFRSSETTPLLGAVDRDEVIRDEELAWPDDDYPKPEIPWLQDSDLDSGDPIVMLAIWVNFIANGVLLIGKILVVISVPSVSVLASLVDAALDFLSTAIVWTTTRLIASSQNDQHRYPVGRRRLEPVGVLVFSIIMVTSFCQVALEALSKLASPEHTIVELLVFSVINPHCCPLTNLFLFSVVSPPSPSCSAQSSLKAHAGSGAASSRTHPFALSPMMR